MKTLKVGYETYQVNRDGTYQGDVIYTFDDGQELSLSTKIEIVDGHAQIIEANMFGHKLYASDLEAATSSTDMERIEERLTSQLGNPEPDNWQEDEARAYRNSIGWMV